MPYGVVCCLPCGEPGAGAYLEKTGFRLEGVSIFAFWPFARATKKHGKRDEPHYRKPPKRSAIRARGRNQKTRSKIIDFGALSSPKSTPGLPKAPQEASRSGWVATAAKSRGQKRPRHASKGFRVPLAGKCDFRRGLRVTGFAHPGPLGTDNYQRKAITTTTPGI